MNECCLEEKKVAMVMQDFSPIILHSLIHPATMPTNMFETAIPCKKYIPANQNWTGMNDVDLLPSQDQSSQYASLKGVKLEDNSEDILKKTLLLKMQLLPQPTILFTAYYLFIQYNTGPVYLFQLGIAPKSSWGNLLLQMSYNPIFHPSLFKWDRWIKDWMLW